MNTATEKQYEHDKIIWNSCAHTYEHQIVKGHPDVTAYEDFEHTFMDRLVISLCRDQKRSLHIYDFGCGSGRLHHLFGRKIICEDTINLSHPLKGNIAHIGGIDFSSKMISIARKKMEEFKLDSLIPQYLSFDVGSAFKVPPYEGKHTPLAVSVCNSIGVMQGPEGAQCLFKTMRRYVEQRKGIAIISCYKQEAVQDFALGNYESTMDVSGQPVWLYPKTYASSVFTLKPIYYKRAYDLKPSIIVDVYDQKGVCIKQNVVLKRDLDKVADTISTGIIDTHNGYNSCWYSTEQIRSWMKEYWPDGMKWHVDGMQLDTLRGAPAQLAILDYSGGFKTIAERWKLRPVI